MLSPVLRKNISLGLEPGIVLGNLEETASMEEGLLHHEGSVELAEDPGRSSPLLCLGLRSRTSLAAENLFLSKQLAFYQERKVNPRRADNPTRLTLVPSRSIHGGEVPISRRKFKHGVHLAGCVTTLGEEVLI
jgi:hypothetical protein